MMSEVPGGQDKKTHHPPPRRRLQPSDKQLKQSCTSQQQSQRSQRLQQGAGGSTMAGLYDLEETLGKGHFATVKAAKHVFTGERVAVKVIDKTKLDSVSQKALLKEVLCMKLVQHPNVVKLYEVIDTSTKMYLVLELGQGDLYDLILRQQGEPPRGLPEPQARVYFKQILTAVSYCHHLHVAHRDLKPENVVFFPPSSSKSSSSSHHHHHHYHSRCSKPPSSSSSSPLGQVKLTDFGFSNKFCPGVNLDTSCGSLAYSAPEILLGDSYDAPSVDIWSLGVILYMLVCGRAPFQEANDSETLTMIMDVKYSLPDGLSKELKHLIQRMLVRDPAKRARLHEIEGHEWVKGQQPEQSDAAPLDSNVPLIVSNRLSEGERDRIMSDMVKGGVVTDIEEIRNSLRSNAYNHITSTFYLLAERSLRDKALLQQASSTRRPSSSTNNPSAPQSPTSASSRNATPDLSSDTLEVENTTPPPPRIRRKNSHVLEDVVLPSMQQSHHHHQLHHYHLQSTTQNIAGLDLETTNNSLKNKFVILPVIEPPPVSEDDQLQGATGAQTTRENSSPHHPHYYHHLGKRAPPPAPPPQENSPPGDNPPKYCSSSSSSVKHHHSHHSDSSDEGGGGGGVVGPNNNTGGSNTTTVLVTSPTTPEEEEEEYYENKQRHNTVSSSNSELLVTSNFLKPSPSYEGIVEGTSGAGGDDAPSSSKRGKKKRVLFLSWFFKRSGGGKVSSSGGGGKGNQQKGASDTSGANGIYKTRSCAELKTRGCNSGGAGSEELNVRECFGVCNGSVANSSSSSTGGQNHQHIQQKKINKYAG